MTTIPRFALLALAYLFLLQLLYLVIERPALQKVLVAGALTLALVAVVYRPIYSVWRSEQASLNSGVLRTVKKGKRDHSKDRPAIQVGTASIFELGPEGRFMELDEDQISVKRVNGELVLTTTVRDKDGNLIVEVIDNHWTVSPLKASCWDKNYTADTLEVKDGRGRVVLQVRVLPDRIQIQGEWANTHNVVADDGQYNARDGLNPIFRYPSEKYWGESRY